MHTEIPEIKVISINSATLFDKVRSRKCMMGAGDNFQSIFCILVCANLRTVVSYGREQ